MKIDGALKKKIRQTVMQEIKKQEKKKALLITSYKMDTAELASFYETFPFLKEKALETLCDTKLIAGFILQWESKIIDASLASRIEAIAAKNSAY